MRLKAARLSSCLVVGSLIWLPTYWLSYFYAGNGASTDLMSVALFSTVAILTAAISFFLRNFRSYALWAMLSFLLILHFFPRFLGYILLAKESRSEMFILFPIEWSAAQINAGTQFLIFSILAMFAGLVVAEKLFWLKFRSAPLASKFNPSVLALAAAGSLSYAVEYYFVFHQGLSANSLCNPSVSFKWLTHLISPDTFTLVVIVILINQWQGLQKKKLVFLLSMVAFYLLFTIALGSRSGLLRIALLSFSAVLLIIPNPRISLFQTIRVLAVTFLFGLLIFPVATSVRMLRIDSCKTPQVSSRTQPDKLEKQFSKSYDPTYLESIDIKDSTKLVLSKSLATSLDRLGLPTDYSIAVVVAPVDQNAIEHYFSSKYFFQTVINNMLPGTPYPEAEIMSARVLPVLFRGRTHQHIEEHYLSELFTIWGWSHLMFGQLAGLLFLMVTTMAMSGSLLLIRRLPNYEVWGTLYIWAGVAGTYLMQGLDYTIVVALYLIIQTMVLLGIVKVIEAASKPDNRRSS